jgi:hypothetical protein
MIQFQFFGQIPAGFLGFLPELASPSSTGKRILNLPSGVSNLSIAAAITLQNPSDTRVMSDIFLIDRR